MKKLLEKFAEHLLSNEQMKTLKGGTFYCGCGPNGEMRVVPPEDRVPGGFTCASWCSNHGF